MMKMVLSLAAAAVVLWTPPAGAPILCPDPKTGEYSPEHCDLLLPIEPNPQAVPCDIIDLWSRKAAPVCNDWWAREEPAMVLQWLHELEEAER